MQRQRRDTCRDYLWAFYLLPSDSSYCEENAEAKSMNGLWQNIEHKPTGGI